MIPPSTGLHSCSTFALGFSSLSGGNPASASALTLQLGRGCVKAAALNGGLSVERDGNASENPWTLFYRVNLDQEMSKCRIKRERTILAREQKAHLCPTVEISADTKGIGAS